MAAWTSPRSYFKGMTLPTDTADKQRARWAIISVQRELIAQQYLNANPDYLNGGFGTLTDRAVRRLQQDEQLVVDGIVGPKTALHLYEPVFEAEEARRVIPGHILRGLIRNESSVDPGCVGSNTNDRGIAQINRDAHPEVSDKTAYANATFCVALAATLLRNAYEKFRSWAPAIACFNNPAKAQQWAQNGIAPDNQIATYVKNVYALTVSP